MKRYEQSIRVITAFFAVLLGFGLKKLLDNEIFQPENARWPCFIMSVFLFLRFLLGSNNHMWFEFVRQDLAQNSAFKAPRTQILNDFLFLVLFGLIGMAICYSKNLTQFLELNLLLTGIGLIWVILYAVIGCFRMKRQGTIPRGTWSYWGWVNLAQFTAVLMIYCFAIPNKWGTVPWWPTFFGAAWEWSLAILVIVYLIILIVDISKQLNIVEQNVA